jgi:large subunit ribosomal protein L19e
MTMNTQRKIAAETLKCGMNRIRILKEKETADALTRNDVRGLIERGAIIKVQKKGSSRASSRKRLAQRAKGRRSGTGCIRGTRNTRMPGKAAWMTRVRALRKLFFELRKGGQLSDDDCRGIYLMIKGGIFRNKGHMLTYLKEHDMLGKRKSKK